ncbi:dehydrogenase, partial [Candidatus Nomurabacteria bacterium]|nr:dehydrogenase [Candidatus Nomurabacteria bacterium]
PGLKIVAPVTPHAAKGCLMHAIRDDNPVIFVEQRLLYMRKCPVPEDPYVVAPGKAHIAKPGTDVTLVGISWMQVECLIAHRYLEQAGISAEVIDARSMVPFNFEKVIESVKKTGKIIVSGDACERGSYLNDLARNIGDLCFDHLDAPAVVLGSRNWITPAYELEEHFFPQADWFIDVIHQRIMPIKGYTPVRSFTDVEMIRRGKLGV